MKKKIYNVIEIALYMIAGAITGIIAAGGFRILN